MIISRLVVRNWKNFVAIDLNLEERVFLVGPNASGKSNLLDIFHFMKDLVVSGGGLYQAVTRRGGINLIRSLAAPKNARIQIELHFSSGPNGDALWRYALDLKPFPGKPAAPMVASERVWKGDRFILDRPDDADRRDKPRLRQTLLENVVTNGEFRPIADFFNSSAYFHLIPHQFRQEGDGGNELLSRGFSRRDFFRQVAAAPPKTRTSRFRKIEAALKLSVPLLEHLRLDESPEKEAHLESTFRNWRKGSPALHDTQLSDGLIRLVGILWSLMEKNSLLLLEEPELSLNTAVVRQLPGLIHRFRRSPSTQVILSTHSPALLSDPGIDGKEVVLLLPAEDRAIKVIRAAELPDVSKLLEQGLSAGDVVLPRIQPARIEELGYFQ